MNKNSVMFRSTRFERETEHGSKYYEIRVQPDLFGLVVIRIWGRRGSPMGRMVTTPCKDGDEAESLYNRCIKQRLRRKYRQMPALH